MTNGNDAVTRRPVTDADGAYVGQVNGLTKREYFAAMAMQGICAAGGNDFSTAHGDRVAEIAITQADALIEALNKPEAK